MKIQRVLRIANSHREADELDVQQQIAMSPDQRRAIVRELQRRVYGPAPPPLRPRRRRGK
ncbi:MAG: hypothetical protein A2V99_00225 [Spirochaetes bacterium RBG_16_67_19]|nr:MAG: hypothetical protein A2V99_00225 [Spirochaetes bacterium RBG_16_67_19]